MKYLKTYNESIVIHAWDYETLREIGVTDDFDIIKDRLVELDDKGFDIKVSYSYYHRVISVRIERPPSRFFVYEVLDDITPLISNMDIRYSLDVKIMHDSQYHTLTKIMGRTHLEQLGYLSSNPVMGITLEFHRRKKVKQ